MPSPPRPRRAWASSSRAGVPPPPGRTVGWRSPAAPGAAAPAPTGKRGRKGVAGWRRGVGRETPVRRGVPPRGGTGGGDYGYGESSCQRLPLGPAPPLSITPLPCLHPFLYLPLPIVPPPAPSGPHAALPPGAHPHGRAASPRPRSPAGRCPATPSPAPPSTARAGCAVGASRGGGGGGGEGKVTGPRGEEARILRRVRC